MVGHITTSFTFVILLKNILRHITSFLLILLLGAFSSGFMLRSVTCLTSGKTMVKVGNSKDCCQLPSDNSGPVISKKCCEKTHQTLDLTDFITTSTDSKATTITPTLELFHFFQPYSLQVSWLASYSNAPPQVVVSTASKHTTLQRYCTFLI